jgi:hypothetical protein
MKKAPSTYSQYGQTWNLGKMGNYTPGETVCVRFGSMIPPFSFFHFALEYLTMRCPSHMLYARFPAKNHYNNLVTPDSDKKVFVYMWRDTGAANEPKTQREVREKGIQVANFHHRSCPVDADKENTVDPETRACGECFVVPDLPPGRYSVQWFWSKSSRTIPQQCQFFGICLFFLAFCAPLGPYASCTDVQVLVRLFF